MIEILMDIFTWITVDIFQRYPRLSRFVYEITYIISLIFCWLFSEMNWLGIIIYPLGVSVILGTIFIAIFYLSIKWHQKNS